MQQNNGIDFGQESIIQSENLKVEYMSNNI